MAQYVGDGSFNTSTSAPALTQTVNPASTTVTLGSTANPSVFGQSAFVTATVAPVAPGAGVPTGSVVFTVDGSPVATANLDATGVASYSTSGLAAGPHTVTAAYNGDSNFRPSLSTGGLQQVVLKADTSVTVTSTANPSVFGQSAVGVRVQAVSPGAGTPRGFVTFTVDGTARSPVQLDGTGRALLAGTPLSVGPHQISVSYAGDPNFNAGSSAGTFSQTVDKASTTTSVGTNPNPTIIGQAVVMTATVAAVAPGNGAPGGTVIFKADGNQVGQGTVDSTGRATASVTTLTVGPHTITALYQGDGSFNGSTSTGITQTVTLASSKVAVTTSVSPSVFGQAVTYTATVSPVAPATQTPTGMVTFKDGANVLGTGPVSGGVATFKTGALSVGSHTITVVYSGDSMFNGSSGTLSSAQVVNKADTSTSVASSHNPAIAGHGSVTFTATVTPTAPGAGTPGGMVTFKDGAVILGTAALTNGQGTLTISSLTHGSHTITASYGGDGNFKVNAVTNALVQTIYTPNEGFVAQVYRDLLHIQVDAGGLSTFSTALDNHTMTRLQVVQTVQNTYDYRSVQVNDIYVSFLHRIADPTGLRNFTNALALGQTVEQVKATIIGSDEYFTKFGGGTVDGYLNRVYQDVLGRNIDPTGLTSLRPALSPPDSAHRSAVALKVLVSVEADSVLVNAFYQTYLRRAADAGGLNNFVSQLQKGVRDEAVIAQLVASDEYFAKL